MKNNFEEAYGYINKDYSTNDIFNVLKSGTDVEKAAVILKINKLENNEQSELLIHHLTNQTGQIRELCAYKLNELSQESFNFFQSQNSLDIIINSLNDVNPNVVRFMLGTLKYIEDKKYILNNLFNKIQDIYTDILNKNRRGKVEEHIFTKKCFKIYWSLEAIKTLIAIKPDLINDNKTFERIIIDLSDFEEYTIREKIAQIVNMLPKFENSDIKRKLANDDNYFVKRNNYENFGCR